MKAEVVKQFQQILFKGKQIELPKELVAMYRKLKFSMDKLHTVDMTPFDLVLIAELAGVLPEPTRLRKVDGPVEGETEEDFEDGLDIPNPEPRLLTKAEHDTEVAKIEREEAADAKKQSKRGRGRPKGSKNKKPEMAEAV